MRSNARARRASGILAGLLCLLALGAVLASGEPQDAEPGGEVPDPGAAPRAPAVGEAAAPGSAENASKATRVVLLGSGTPIPDPSRSGPAVAVLARGRPYLVDFGPGVVRQAVAAQLGGLPALDMRKFAAVFLTHLHSDHTAGYPDLIFTPAVAGRADPLQVYGPPGLGHMTAAVLEAYREDVAARRLQKDGGDMRGYRVEAHEVEPGPVYQDDAVKVSAHAVEHGAWEHAYAYRFDAPDRSIVISGDTAPTDAIIGACDGCDVLVHEVYCQAGLERGPANWKSYHPAYHTSSSELARIAKKARPKLLVLYHVLFMGCSERQLLRDVRREYPGKVVLGRDLERY